MKEAARLAEALNNKLEQRNNLHLLGYLYCEAGKYDLSQKAFNSYLNMSKKEYENGTLQDLYYHLGILRLEMERGKIDSAQYHISSIESNLEKISDTFNKDRIKYLKQILLAEILLSKNRVNEAMRTAKECRSYVYNGYHPMNSFPTSRDILARVYVRKGAIHEAIEEYERLTNFNPDSKDYRLIYPKYHYRLAKLYEQTGQTDKAIQKYERFLELWKNADAGQADLINAKKRLANLRRKN
jgi:tetratricopeptide (TPR) repeat protein